VQLGQAVPGRPARERRDEHPPDAASLPRVGDRHRDLVVEGARKPDHVGAVERRDRQLPPVAVQRVHPRERHVRAPGHEPLADRVDAEPVDERLDELPIRPSKDADLDHAVEHNLLLDKLTRSPLHFVIR
jgi:hypothetical protein